jgi:hypothetical protein
MSCIILWLDVIQKLLCVCLREREREKERERERESISIMCCNIYLPYTFSHRQTSHARCGYNSGSSNPLWTSLLTESLSHGRHASLDLGCNPSFVLAPQTPCCVCVCVCVCMCVCVCVCVCARARVCV